MTKEEVSEKASKITTSEEDFENKEGVLVTIALPEVEETISYTQHSKEVVERVFTEAGFASFRWIEAAHSNQSLFPSSIYFEAHKI